MRVENNTEMETKSWGYLPPKANLCYEITRVNTNRFKEDFEEYYMLRMWGDRRVSRLRTEDEQSAFHFYAKSFAEAKSVAMEAFKLLAEDSTYRNVYMQRDKLEIKRVKEEHKSPEFSIIDRDKNYLYINGKQVTGIRDIIKPYLEANLKGSGFQYAERSGFEGEIKPFSKYHNNKFVLVDIEEEQVIFTIVTPNSEETFKMPKIELKECIKEDKALTEYFLACEFVVSKVWEAKLSEPIITETKYTI